MIATAIISEGDRRAPPCRTIVMTAIVVVVIIIIIVIVVITRHLKCYHDR